MSIKVLFSKDFCTRVGLITNPDFYTTELAARNFVSSGLGQLQTGSTVKIHFNECRVETPKDESARWLVGVFGVEVQVPHQGTRGATLTCRRYFEKSDASFTFSVDGNKTILGHPSELFDKMV